MASRAVLDAPQSSTLTATEKTGEGGERPIGNMMLDPFGIELGAVLRDADGDQEIDHKPMAGADASGKVEAARG